MSDKKVFLITGASRGLGVDLARAALDAGHAVVATGRSADRVRAALGAHDELLVVALDVTDPASARVAVAVAVERFGRVDVLVNNAGNFIAGTFEEISDADLRAQLETNFFGPLNVARAVLPVMRAQRSGHVVTISSLAGVIGQYFCSAYAASKFALEGWMERAWRRRSHRSASGRRSSSPASSAPSCSAGTRPATPSPPSRTTARARPRRSRTGPA